MKSTYYIATLSLSLLFLTNGCKKYLSVKSNQSLVTINSLRDLQSLLDNYGNINLNTPCADEVSADDYFLTYNDYLSLDIDQQRNMYSWQPANLFYPYTNLANDWTQTYNNVYIANTVLDNISTVERSASNAAAWDNVKGQALFLRAYSFYRAAGIWSLAYDNSTASQDLGIPLRLNSNFNERSTRSTVAQTYGQIISDANAAAGLLAKTPVQAYRSGRPAAYGLLARTYLAMRNYNLAGAYADSCLQLNNKLIDFNTLNTSASYPIGKFNDEVIYDSSMSGSSGALPITRTKARIDTNLIRSYDKNDLRTTAFFSTNADGNKLFKGSYEGGSSRFNGIATDEIYLIRAECFARKNNIAAALSDLNGLLKKRYRTGTFTDITAAGSQEAVTKVLVERQKELVMRGTRWTDIKRLNKENAGISLKRILNGTTYILPPNDLRFALPIPDDIISLSGIQQNPR